MKYLPIVILYTLLVASCRLSPGSISSPDWQATPTLTSYKVPEPTDLPLINPITLDQESFLMDELQAHTELYRSMMLTEPGWVHLIIRPDGYDKTDITHTAAERYEEGWYLLDDRAQVHSAVERLVDEKGHTTQTFVFTNGSWRDASNGKVIIRGLPRYFEQGVTYYRQAARLLEKGEKLNSQTIYSNCWYIGEQYTISDGKFLLEVVIDPAMGNLRVLKTWELVDGAIELVSGIDVLKEEHVLKPPAEIVSLLEKDPGP